MNDKAPAFQFYPADYLSDGNVAMMGLEHEGAYLRLMCYCWKEGALPNDIDALARLCRVTTDKMAELWEVIKNCFKVDEKNPKVIKHPRLDKERKKQKKYSSEQSDRAKKSWATRRQRDGLALPDECRPAMQAQCSSSSSSSSSSEKIPPKPPRGKVGLNSPEFEIFWTAYPKKSAKPKAFESWQRKELDPRLDEVMAGLNLHKASDQWTRDGGQYIPNPTTFLNQERWKDEVFNPVPSSKPVMRVSGNAIVPNSQRVGGILEL